MTSVDPAGAPGGRVPFKRMNFFDGFFTTAEDWQADQRYHLGKRRLHNRYLHTPGIVPGEGDGLKVTATNDPNATQLQVRVGSGTAIDGEGNLVFLAEPVIRDVAPRPAAQSQQIYITLRLSEVETDRQENAEDPDYRGNTRVEEQALVEVSAQEPDGSRTLELARINLQAGATAILDPADPDHPQANEIDRRFAWKAGGVDWRFGELLGRLQKAYKAFREAQRQHDLALFTPGVLAGMRVEPAGGLTVQVLPGAALDPAGQHLVLSAAARVAITPVQARTLIYIYARYEDRFEAYLDDLKPETWGSDPGRPFTGFDTAWVGSAESLQPEWLELARIDLAPGAQEIRLPADPGRPGQNEIDQRRLEPAHSRSVVEIGIKPELKDLIIDRMREKRAAFTALGRRFRAAATIADVRQTALNVELMARNGDLRPKQTIEVWSLLAALEQDVGQEIADRYPPVVERPEYKRYQDALAGLDAALYAREPDEVLLNRQATVVNAATELAQVVFAPPHADAGPDQEIDTQTGHAQVTLDASGSSAEGSQKIVRYHWDKEE